MVQDVFPSQKVEHLSRRGGSWCCSSVLRLLLLQGWRYGHTYEKWTLENIRLPFGKRQREKKQKTFSSWLHVEFNFKVKLQLQPIAKTCFTPQTDYRPAHWFLCVPHPALLAYHLSRERDHTLRLVTGVTKKGQYQSCKWVCPLLHASRAAGLFPERAEHHLLAEEEHAS